MKSNYKQLLRNPNIQPTSDIIAEALQDANDSYIKFLNELANQDIDLEWRYYTDGKAWLGKGLYKWLGVRGGQKVTTVFWLSIWEGFFKITIYIPEKARDDLFSLPLNNTTKQMINDSKQMGNRLKFFPLVFELNSNESFEQIHILFDFKKSLK